MVSFVDHSNVVVIFMMRSYRCTTSALHGVHADPLEDA
jgi:hypothetical protein